MVMYAIRCDCDLQWLQDLYKTKQDSYNLPVASCDTPKELTGEGVGRIKESLCDLDDSGLATWAIVLVILFVIFCLIVLTIVLVWYFKWGGVCPSSTSRRNRLKRPKKLNSKGDIVVVPVKPSDLTLYRDIENIYEDPAEVPLGGGSHYPDIKTTVL
jgi:hypothetical protein